MTTTLRPARPAHTDLRTVFGTRVGFWLARALDLTVRGAADLETGAGAADTPKVSATTGRRSGARSGSTRTSRG